MCVASCTHATLVMVFDVTCTICEGPEVDARRSESVTLANCQY